MTNSRKRRSIPGRILGKIGRAVDPALAAMAARWGWFGSVYYGLLNSAFRREHRAVAYGRLRYAEDCASPEGCHYLLRRNTHRIEKGLLMRPFRDVYALDYIAGTVACYEKMVSSAVKRCKDSDEAELLWAYDVLHSYFAVAGSHPVIDRARARFESVKHPCEGRECSLVPYARDLNVPPPVAYEQFLELSRRRRSVRWYLPQPVPRELIDRAVSLAALSPSGCNRQAFEFRILDEPQLVREVASIPQGTGGFSDNLPALAVVIGKLRAYSVERDRHMIYIDAGLASMSFVYALETLGLSSCCLNWPDVASQETEVAGLLGLEPDERVLLLIALGYPDPEGKVASSQKKSLDQLRRYNLP